MRINTVIKIVTKIAFVMHFSFLTAISACSPHITQTVYPVCLVCLLPSAPKTSAMPYQEPLCACILQKRFLHPTGGPLMQQHIVNRQVLWPTFMQPSMWHWRFGSLVVVYIPGIPMTWGCTTASYNWSMPGYYCTLSGCICTIPGCIYIIPGYYCIIPGCICIIAGYCICIIPGCICIVSG